MRKEGEGEKTGKKGSAGSGKVRYGVRLLGARLDERGADPQPRDAAEVAEVAGDEFEVMMKCRGGNLEIGVGQDPPLVLEASLVAP